MVKLDMAPVLTMLLNNSLALQRITDVKVYGLSPDFKRAFVEHIDENGKVKYRGVVMAETLLPKGGN